MQEIIHRCDFQVSKGKACGEKVPNNEPTTFALGDATYKMDICEAHQKYFREQMQQFINIAEPTRSRAGKAVRQVLKGKKGQTFTTKDVRLWLQEQGRDVSPTGRIPDALLEEYKQHSGV